MKKYIILLTAILGSLWGCDVLNQEPISMTTEKMHGKQNLMSQPKLMPSII